MRVRWNSLGGTLLKETELMRKLELSQIKKQIEVLTTFLPDLIVRLPQKELQEVHHFVGVLLFADVSGFTPLCEKYNKTGKGGIYRLTATLNAYIGAIVEVIYFYGGDVLKFSGDAFLAMWKAEPDHCLYRVIHEVIVCALFIQQTLGCFETEVNVLLKVKLAISCGNMTFSVIGDEDNKHYVILGAAINDVKAAEHASVSGDVVIAPTAWGHVAEESYDVTYTEGGNVKVWRCLYKPTEKAKKDYYDQKYIIVQKLCEKHINHRNTLHATKKFEDTLTDSKITDRFVRSLPEREVMKIASQKWIAADMKPFIIKPVQEQIEEKQPLEYLTEMREVTIQFINIVPKTFYEPKLVVMVNSAYQIVCSIVCKLLGVVNKVSLFDKDAMMLVLFGLRGIKHELESQNALMSGFKIRKAVSRLEGVKSVSVGVTNGLVYCGVVGHPLRREYTVIGGSVNKAARMMCAFENKVTCDYKTYKNSKLSSYYFQMQSAVKLKGIEDAGHIFEYNEDFEETIQYQQHTTPLIGREDEISFVYEVIHHPEKVNDYKGICFYGKQKIGKSRVLQESLIHSVSQGHAVASADLSGNFLRPYFCISLLYKQLYDAKANVNSGEADSIKDLPPDIWNLNEILQKSNFEARTRKAKIINIFRRICSSSKTRITVIFVDKVQYIDVRSLEVIEEVLKEKSLRFFSAGHFEEDNWDIQWKLSLSEHIKMLEMDPLMPDDIPALACQMLKIRGIPKKLVSLLTKTCEGRPGWVQSCLLRLVNNGCLEIKYVAKEDEDNDKYIFPDAELLHERYIDIRRKESGERKILWSVAQLSDNFKDQSEELTLAAISLDLFDSFAPYQQLVIKTGAVLGEIFARSLLFVMLKYPNEQLFANAIMKLYEEDVLDCGTRYVSSGGLLTKKLCCLCFIEDEDILKSRRRSFELPKYAFCKLLHFKNKSLRSIAYELLPANQRKELHSRITDVLENQNNSCPNCLRDDSAAIIKLRTFKQMMQYCINPQTNYGPPATMSEFELSEYKSHGIKDIIREHVRKDIYGDNNTLSAKSKSSSKSTAGTSISSGEPAPDVKPFKRKIWDPTTCFCLEILTRVYADLVYHSERAGHLGKRIFYLMQYGVVLITLREFRDSIPVLTEASELCMRDAKNKNSLISEAFRRLHIGKIHMLLAEATYRLDDTPTAKVHVTICLRQYNIPMLSLKYKLPHFFLNRPNCFNKLRASEVFWDTGARTMMNIDFGICMNLVSCMFASEGQWNLAKLAAERSICLLISANANINLLCDSYSTAIELYNFCGDSHTCERLERCVSRQVLRTYTGNMIIELYAICKLIAIIFQTRIMHGHIRKAIRIGYRAMDLNITIQAYYVQTEVVPILASTLLLVKKIENAVSIIKILYSIGKTVDESALLDYYAFCVELNIETSFLLEPIEACEEFAEKHFEKQINKSVYSNSENKLIVFLHMYHLRNNRWPDALKWKTMIRLDKSEYNSICSIANWMKYTESLLITLVWNIEMKKTYLNLEEKRIEMQLKQCEVAAKKWELFMPRYLHYRAYYSKITGRKRQINTYLKKATKWATKQQNLLEICWISQSKSTWSGGLNFGNDMKEVDWRFADSYSSTEWSQILYALPCNM
ncbi:hypothetical protein ILUMI_10155 [Ignelater luminosus]|uniref:Guanylate cyclase domain-containing protein n=1 Tax=Ignelater luminosus TaxID=2038154 RepID=A0A8K0GF88_IGNLU|nr:hypothetical protein ILUMI_10155 [Ignelater luminosus]